MAVLDLNEIRKLIEKRLINELKKAPPIEIIFGNQPFTPVDGSGFVQCLIEFTDTEFLTQINTTTFNNLNGVITINIFTKIGVGLGNNLNLAKRIRDLYNRVIVEDVLFQPSIGPTVLQNANPEGYVQSVLSIPFEILETL